MQIQGLDAEPERGGRGHVQDVLMRHHLPVLLEQEAALLVGVVPRLEVPGLRHPGSNLGDRGEGLIDAGPLPGVRGGARFSS